jgi:hypothetical protein
MRIIPVSWNIIKIDAEPLQSVLSDSTSGLNFIIAAWSGYKSKWHGQKKTSKFLSTFTKLLQEVILEANFTSTCLNKALEERIVINKFLCGRRQAWVMYSASSVIKKSVIAIRRLEVNVSFHNLNAINSVFRRNLKQRQIKSSLLNTQCIEYSVMGGVRLLLLQTCNVPENLLLVSVCLSVCTRLTL